MTELNTSPWLDTRRIAAFSGFLAVALGAFGAHGLRATLAANGTAEIWITASTYHLLHSVVLLFVALMKPPSRLPAILFTAGIVLFSVPLYVLAVTNIKGLGALAPVGGVCLLAGWLSIAFCRSKD